MTFSLGVVRFVADPNESPSGLVPSLALGPGTSLSDVVGNSIPFKLPNAAVPEPSSAVMLVLGSVGLLGMAVRQRAST